MRVEELEVSHMSFDIHMKLTYDSGTHYHPERPRA